MVYYITVSFCLSVAKSPHGLDGYVRSFHVLFR